MYERFPIEYLENGCRIISCINTSNYFENSDIEIKYWIVVNAEQTKTFEERFRDNQMALVHIINSEKLYLIYLNQHIFSSTHIHATQLVYSYVI